MYEEFIHVLGILYMMEAVELLESRMYWKTEAKGFFPGLCFSNMWQLSGLDDMDQQVLDFINAVNVNLKGAMRACEVLCVDESMVKAFHRDLDIYYDNTKL